MNNRWYDNHTETTETFKLLKNLDYDSLQTLADDIIEISNQIKYGLSFLFHGSYQ